MPLLDEGDCLFHGFRKFKRAQHDSQPPSAKSWHWQFLSHLDILPAIDDPHAMKFLQKLLSGLDSKGVIGRELLNLTYQGSDEPTDFIIVWIVLSILEVVPVHDTWLSSIGLGFPVIEVHLFEQLLLMVLQFSHGHCWRFIINILLSQNLNLSVVSPLLLHHLIGFNFPSRIGLDSLVF